MNLYLSKKIGSFRISTKFTPYTAIFLFIYYLTYGSLLLTVVVTEVGFWMLFYVCKGMFYATRWVITKLIALVKWAIASAKRLIEQHKSNTQPGGH